MKYRFFLICSSLALAISGCADPVDIELKAFEVSPQKLTVAKEGASNFVMKWSVDMEGTPDYSLGVQLLPEDFDRARRFDGVYPWIVESISSCHDGICRNAGEISCEYSVSTVDPSKRSISCGDGGLLTVEPGVYILGAEVIAGPSGMHPGNSDVNDLRIELE